MIALQHYLVVSAALFALGILVLLLFGVMLTHKLYDLDLRSEVTQFLPGLIVAAALFAVFVIVIAAAEVAVALAIVLTLYRLKRTPNLDEATSLRG